MIFQILLSFYLKSMGITLDHMITTIKSHDNQKWGILLNIR